MDAENWTGETEESFEDFNSNILIKQNMMN